MKKSIMHLQRLTIAFLFSFTVINMTGQTRPVSNLPQYLFPEFANGKVLMKNGTSYTVLMNYNTVTEQMAFYQNGNLLNLAKPETVDTIFLESMKFVFFENSFCEILSLKPFQFFIEHKSNLETQGKPAAYGAPSQTSSSTAISKLYNDKEYNLKLPDNFKVTYTPIYWVRINNEMNKFSNQRQFLKLFPSKNTELKKYISQSNINFKKHDDLVKLSEYCNLLFRQASEQK
jgi:hypothetical protein